MSSTSALLPDLRKRLSAAGPFIDAVFEHLAPRLIPDEQIRASKNAKRFNDPIWKTIKLDYEEVALVELPLFQRLRRIRQLGLAYLVYPSAHHTRFEHSLGALHVAEQMLATLTTKSEDQGPSDRDRRLVRLAALLHDCGHTSFSHVGERALNAEASICDQFRTVNAILNEAFKDQVREQLADLMSKDKGQPAPSTLGQTSPPTAELISILLVLSAPMERFASRLGVTAEDLMLVASLIMGRPHNFSDKDGIYPDYLKSIVSGDLDSDKLDYVARDAYFAGIPIAADVDRLISQLALVNHVVRSNTNRKLNCKLLGVLPSGVSAFEMFVMTRSYMFSRVYQHPKVRVAERALVRSIGQALAKKSAAGGDVERNVIDLLYGIHGDDACLLQLDQDLGASQSIAQSWRKPRRALAITPRNVVGYDEDNGLTVSALLKQWSKAADVLINDPSPIESKIAKLLGATDDAVVVDWQRPPNIKENPAIFVSDAFAKSSLTPISRAFDISQLAKAYEDVKSLAWVFVDHENIADASVAAAIVLNDEFGLMPRKSAITDAKIDLDEFAHALEDLKKTPHHAGLIGASMDAISTNLRGTLVIPARMLERYLPFAEADRTPAAFELADALAALNLSYGHLGEVNAALTVLRAVGEFIVDKQEEGQTAKLSLDETELQKELSNYLRARFRDDDTIQFSQEAQGANGRLDLLVSAGRSNRIRVVVELKAEEATFETSVKNNIDQLESYLAQETVGRVGILFCRFKCDDDRKLRELVELKALKDDKLAICVGQNVPRDTASRRKRLKGAPASGLAQTS
ncbi:hypothetical protein GCM10008171_29130 [Methylopila jiangsuensis]|uniref:HD/PDEase domain-containing protein n=1 Tax=Methylopila jiangsuensis TaxID=586230 RepID=A0A9W6JL18_9HYPH|nr:HD domain-containing protein [Methylopila jiangsuensis]MDR6284954.1 HD superfamily phosphohydrolase [Methylopila jiangsuensis]GLK77659.1 hypothetical protein GCM10008171_29130 [Methylopila jiangsuensis]